MWIYTLLLLSQISIFSYIQPTIGLYTMKEEQYIMETYIVVYRQVHFSLGHVNDCVNIMYYNFGIGLSNIFSR